jgi:hypothetical protein
MSTGSFDPDEIRQALLQNGLSDMLSEAQVVMLESALSALGQRSAEVEQLQAPDVSAEAFREWADQLVQMFDNCEFTGEIVDSTVRFAITWAWWATVNRQAKAILCLYDAGLGADTPPLVRSMIEHCLWSVALARDEGPLLTTIFRLADAERKKMIKDAVGGLLELPAEILALVDATPSPSGEGSPTKSFAGICRDLGVSKTVGVIWRMLSSLSHPTSTTAYFLTQPSAEGVKITKTPALPGVDPAGLAEQAVSLAVQCMLWAGFAIDRLMATHPLRSTLETVAAEARVADLGEQGPSVDTGASRT